MKHESQWQRWLDDDAVERGSSVVGLAVLTPVMAMLLFFVVAAGRVGVIEGKLTTAASGAARAATQYRSMSAAQAAAITTAETSLSQLKVGCQGGPRVYFPIVDLRPGGMVQVRVSCAVHLSDLTLFDIPGNLMVSADSLSVVDRYRSESTQP